MRNSIHSLVFLVLFSMFSTLVEANEKPIAIVIPSYKNKDWYEKNLTSVLFQDYSNYRIIYMDDCSPDKTGKRVQKILKNHHVENQIIVFDDSECKTIAEATEKFANLVNKNEHFFTLVKNKNRCGALANLYRSIHSCRDHEIVVTLDGDDWFLHPNVLKQLNEVYSTQDVWLTHGALKEYPSGNVSWCEPVPQKYIENNAFRDFKCPSHLRTFYAWLFKKIKLEDLLYEGNFFKMTWDFAMMFPMIEMAGERHAFIYEANYVYNMANQINDNKVNADLQNKLDKFIRNKDRYQRLDEEPNL